MKLGLITALFLINAHLFGQAKVSSIRLNESGSSWLSYSFPFINHPDKKVAKKINGFLQSTILDNPVIETDSAKIFERSRYLTTDSSTQPGLSMVDYSVELNTKKLLSIAFQLEGTGAYSEGSSSYYSFDLRSGNRVTAKNIFTPQGLVQIKKKLIRERQRLIEKYLEETDSTYSDEDLPDSAWIKETFFECNKRASEENIFIKRDKIIFYKEYCFPHAARPLDIDLDITWSAVSVEKYLSAYGRELLLNKKPAQK